jgi:tryptophanase
VVKDLHDLVKHVGVKTVVVGGHDWFVDLPSILPKTGDLPYVPYSWLWED